MGPDFQSGPINFTHELHSGLVCIVSKTRQTLPQRAPKNADRRPAIGIIGD